MKLMEPYKASGKKILMIQQHDTTFSRWYLVCLYLAGSSDLNVVHGMSNKEYEQLASTSLGVEFKKKRRKRKRSEFKFFPDGAAQPESKRRPARPRAKRKAKIVIGSSSDSDRGHVDDDMEDIDDDMEDSDDDMEDSDDDMEDSDDDREDSDDDKEDSDDDKESEGFSGASSDSGSGTSDKSSSSSSPPSDDGHEDPGGEDPEASPCPGSAEGEPADIEAVVAAAPAAITRRRDRTIYHGPHESHTFVLTHNAAGVDTGYQATCHMDAHKKSGSKCRKRRNACGSSAHDFEIAMRELRWWCHMGPAYADGYKHNRCPFPDLESLPSMAELDEWDRKVEAGEIVHQDAPEVHH